MKHIKNLWLDVTFNHFESAKHRNPVRVENLDLVCFGKVKVIPRDRLSEEFREWVDGNIQGKCFFKIWNNTAYFSRQEDAMIFKLRFG